MITPEALKERYIPFSSLRYSTEAFIDYCIPESKPKYNYALIGPGVSQSASQPVSLREPHGFQVGGVSMPHGKTNPAHMHFTCEVFMCTRGDWAIQWGFNPEVSSATIGEGDIVSVPTWLYRGFTNIGIDDGYLFTALGGDNTGGVLWGPSTLDTAARHGVFLTEDYLMVDTNRGERMPEGARRLEPMTPDDIGALRVWPPEAMLKRIVRFKDLQWSRTGLLDSKLPGCGAQMAAAIGLGMTQDRDLQAPVANAHGVSIEWLKIPPGGRVSRHMLHEKQVIISKLGRISVAVETTQGEQIYPLNGTATAWDTFSLPAGCWRRLTNEGPDEALALVLTAGDHRKRPVWDEATLRTVAEAGLALDANGFVAERRFVERAQR